MRSPTMSNNHIAIYGNIKMQRAFCHKCKKNSIVIDGLIQCCESTSGQFGNFAESEKVGVPAWKGAFIRLQDKYTRACNLIARDGEAKVKDEKLEDTLTDLANYAVIVMCLREEAQQNKPKLPVWERAKVDCPLSWEAERTG